MSSPEIEIFGLQLGPVAVILIGNAIAFFILMNADILLGRAVRRLGPNFTKFFLIWVFLMFAIFASAPVIFGVDINNLALIMGTVVLFGVFVPGFGFSNIKRNFVIMLVSILGAIVGYQVAILFFKPV